MNDHQNPYKNNSYLRSDEEVLKELLFFEQFKIELQEGELEEPNEVPSGKDDR